MSKPSITFLITVLLVTAMTLLPRLLLLSHVPTTIVHDEIVYVGLARVLSISGSDFTGTWSPLSLTPPHVLYAELPAVLMAPAAFFINNPLIAARITQALFGAGLCIILGLFAATLFDNKKIGWFTWFIACWDPWIFQFSRLSFDALFGLFFYFAAILTALKFSDWRRYLALPLFALGFFQYQGLKIILLPLVLLLAAYGAYQDRQHKKAFWSWGVIVLGVVLLYGFYSLKLSSQSASQRLNDVIFFNETYVSSLVDGSRRLTFINPLNKVFTNKATIVVQELMAKYSQAFNPLFLFVQGENVRNPFSVWSIGLFLPVDALLIIIGFMKLWQQKKWRPQAFFLTGLVLIGPLPSALNSLDSWIMFRSSFLFMGLVLLSGIGAWDLMQLPLTPLRKRRLWIGLLAAIYLLNIVWFQYHYWFRYPLYSTKGSALAERIMSSYIQRQPNQNITVLADEGEFVFTNILVFSGLITRENLSDIHQAYQSRVFSLTNRLVTTDCLDKTQLKPGTTIINSAINPPCDGDDKNASASGLPATAIVSQLDGGAQYRIYNDELCAPHSLSGFQRNASYYVFDIENLSDQEFCQRWIIQQSE